ncbi:MAG: hypothetical protein JWL62_1677, partial [Hyphomicrobiales bacterium]|nr:hypothetical protein [Hyphomicrobiales bacterium]
MKQLSPPPSESGSQKIGLSWRLAMNSRTGIKLLFGFLIGLFQILTSTSSHA